MIYNVLLEFASGVSLADLIKKSSGHGLFESDIRKYTKSMLVGLNTFMLVVGPSSYLSIRTLKGNVAAVNLS
jgi:hypothetical protein